MIFHGFAGTDVGLRRQNNEDAYLCNPRVGVFAVADGMGGHAGGEVASAMAIETLDAALAESEEHVAQRLPEIARTANRRILDRSQREPALYGMGTTFTAFAAHPGDRYRIVHAGDSRAYLLRAGTLSQLTHDHTWVQAQVDAGNLTPRQARTHPRANVITRSLGFEKDLEVDVVEGRVEAGDLFLLCTDGLTGMVEDADLHTLLMQPLRLDVLVRHLLEAANLRGGSDNVTAVVFRAAGSPTPSGS